jgi:hypothetical protein
MNITRFNYEEYFLLYTDNELTPAERRAVEEFVQENPDLREELSMLQQATLRADRKIVFDDKASLLKNSAPANPVNESNYEEYFILYGDNELTNEEKDLVEQFVYRHPQYQSEFEILQQARLEPEMSTLFPDKKLLYRSEKDERVVVIRWWKIAAAAAILVFIGTGAWFFLNNNDNKPSNTNIARTATKSDSSNPSVTAPSNNDQVAEAIRENNDSNTNVASNPASTKDQPRQDRRLIQDPKEEMLVAENSQKKSSDISNPRGSEIVTPLDGSQTVAKVDIPVNKTESEKISTGAIVGTPDVAVDFDRLSEDDPEPSQATYASNTDDGKIEVLNTSVNAKSKVRGFFRKVGRVVDKATNFTAGNDERDDKKGVRIASFQIALK